MATEVDKERLAAQLFLAKSLFECGLHQDSAKILKAIWETDRDAISEDSVPICVSVWGCIITGLRTALLNVKTLKVLDHLTSIVKGRITEILDILVSWPNRPPTAFRLKSQADFERYMAEVAGASERAQIVSSARRHYARAIELCSPAEPVLQFRARTNLIILGYDAGETAKAAADIASLRDELDASIGRFDDAQRAELQELLDVHKQLLGKWQEA